MLALSSAVGLVLLALADDAGRAAAPWADALFWAGLLTMFVPTAARILLPTTSRRERIAGLLVLGMALYLEKILKSPFNFTDIDEFLHWKSAQDIAATHHLFQSNSLLPISPLYPGLEIVTNAFSSLSGLPIVGSGMIVIGVARLVLVLGLYFFYEQVSGSAQVAGIATLLYLANPGILDFDANYAYGSLALPLGILVLSIVVSRVRAGQGQRRAGLTLVLWLSLAAVVVTHHLTSYMLVAFLALWAVVFIAPRRAAWRRRWGPGEAALISLLLSVMWIVSVGELVVSYLSPRVVEGVGELTRIVTRTAPGRQLFHDGAGHVAPAWERVTAFASVGLILLGLSLGLFVVWRRQRANSAAVALGVATLAYPLVQAFRLTADGAESAVRVTDFLFVAIAFVLALAVTQLLSWRGVRMASLRVSRRFLSHGPGRLRLLRFVAITSLVTILYVGEIIEGSGPPWNRLPGPYLVASGTRSIGPEGVAAAGWTNVSLGPGHRVATDFTDQLLFGTYGGQQVITNASDRVSLAPEFLSSRFGPDQVALLQLARVQVLVVDRRLSTALPGIGFYYDNWESDADHATPVAPQALAKFDQVKAISRLFDSGNIVIYDVGALTNGP